MARSINKVILIGNLGADPETRYTAGGKAVTNFSLATTESWSDKQSGEKKEHTEWHRVVFFDGLAEVAEKYLRKGSRCYVEGRLQTRKWQGQDGQDRYTTEVVGWVMLMLGGGRGDDASAPGQRDESSRSTRSGSGASRPATTAPNSESSGPPDDFDDDIPF